MPHAAAESEAQAVAALHEQLDIGLAQLKSRLHHAEAFACIKLAG